MKIKNIICDQDGTFVAYDNEPFHSSWEALVEALHENKRKEFIKLREYYYEKRELYSEWFFKQVKLLEGLKLEDVEKALFPIPYSPGSKEFFSSLNGDYKKGILTSGVDLVAKKICEEMKFDFYRGNSFKIVNNIFTGEAENSFNLWEKDKELENLAKKFGFKLNETMYVGDHENDLLCFCKVAVPIAFNPKTERLKTNVLELGGYVINDFRELDSILKEENKTRSYFFR